MTETADVIIIGAGQAGLSLSHELAHAGVDHLVLERGRVGETWRGRWESFCLVIPNWTVRLPGGHYAGDDPRAAEMPPAPTRRSSPRRSAAGNAQGTRAP